MTGLPGPGGQALGPEGSRRDSCPLDHTVHCGHVRVLSRSACLCAHTCRGRTPSGPPLQEPRSPPGQFKEPRCRGTAHSTTRGQRVPRAPLGPWHSPCPRAALTSLPASAQPLYRDHCVGRAPRWALPALCPCSSMDSMETQRRPHPSLTARVTSTTALSWVSLLPMN